MLVFVRNSATNLLPLILGLFFKISGTSTRVMTVLSNMGLCVSVKTVDRLKKQVSDDAICLARELIHSGRIFYIIFDNINIYLKKSQERVTNKHEMINATNSAVGGIDEMGIDISEALDPESRRKMLGCRQNANWKDIQPTADDDTHLEASFIAILAEILGRYSPGVLKHLTKKEREQLLREVQEMMPTDRPLPPVKTDMRPFGVVNENEGSKDGVARVIRALWERAATTVEGSGKSLRYFLGDWLTVNNIRSARRVRADDRTPLARLEGIEEWPTLWHFALQATHMIMRAHLGFETMDPHCLARHKTLLRRTWDTKKPNYAAAKSLIRHSLIARVFHITM
jgi:hypothetical protein